MNRAGVLIHEQARISDVTAGDVLNVATAFCKVIKSWSRKFGSPTGLSCVHGYFSFG